jgi:aryl-alcohol dehydrogenase-like predicted oxidoreductase
MDLVSADSAEDITLHPLEHRPLGRTSLHTTVMGYGAGGYSRAGLSVGLDHAAEVVSAALAAGVNIVDTAESYGTEAAVAEGVARSGVRRDDVIVASKVSYREGDELRTPGDVADAVVARLAALRTEHLDVIQLHAVLPSDYTWARDELLPVLHRLRDRGAVRYIGLTEYFQQDPGHQTLARAISDGCWDTVMVGYNLLNQTARERVIDPAERVGIGVMVMFAVREALVDIDRLASYVIDRSTAGETPADFDPESDVTALRALLDRDSLQLADLAYRFAAAPTGVSTVLVGTGNPAHLADNRASLAQPPLPSELLAELERLFVGVDLLTGESSH